MSLAIRETYNYIIRETYNYIYTKGMVPLQDSSQHPNLTVSSVDSTTVQRLLQSVILEVWVFFKSDQLGLY